VSNLRLLDDDSNKIFISSNRVNLLLNNKSAVVARRRVSTVGMQMHLVNISIILCELSMTRFFFWKLSSRVLQGFSVTVPLSHFMPFLFVVSYLIWYKTGEVLVLWSISWFMLNWLDVVQFDFQFIVILWLQFSEVKGVQLRYCNCYQVILNKTMNIFFFEHKLSITWMYISGVLA
jgi:hypothetical protein